MEFLSNRITAIRNGEQVGLPSVTFSPEKGKSKNAILILNKLREEGFIRGFSLNSPESNTKDKSKTKQSKFSRAKFKILLKYDGTGQGSIQAIFSVSTSSRRTYLGVRSLWQSQSIAGLFILSITLGFMIDGEARWQNVGGEVLLGVK